jgi:hypothetical protein
MIRFILFILLLSTASCALFDGFKKRAFTYGEAGNNIALLVPKGWHKQEVKPDSAGNKKQSYYYKDGSSIYFVRAADTTKSYQYFDTAMHIPLVHPSGGLIFKKVDSAGLYSREIRINVFRFGYINVPTEREARFDSALNYAAEMKVK